MVPGRVLLLKLLRPNMMKKQVWVQAPQIRGPWADGHLCFEGYLRRVYFMYLVTSCVALIAEPNVSCETFKDYFDLEQLWKLSDKQQLFKPVPFLETEKKSLQQIIYTLNTHLTRQGGLIGFSVLPPLSMASLHSQDLKFTSFGYQSLGHSCSICTLKQLDLKTSCMSDSVKNTLRVCVCVCEIPMKQLMAACREVADTATFVRPLSALCFTQLQSVLDLSYVD